jgi:hypothetical protein
MKLFICLSFMVFCLCIGLYGDEVSEQQQAQPTEEIEPNKPENKEIEEKGSIDPWVDQEDGSQ